MNQNTLKLGDYNALCDVCGFKYKASELKTRWDGIKVCSKDFETRHPQDLRRPARPQKPLPWTRPEPAADVFIGPTYIATTVGNQEPTVPSGTFNTTSTVN